MGNPEGSQQLSADDVLHRLMGWPREIPARRGTISDSAAAAVSRPRQRTTALRNDTGLQRLSGAAGVDLRRRVRRPVRHSSGGQRLVGGGRRQYQYAFSHLKTPLLVVLGHEGCGAINAALETKHRNAQHRSRSQVLVDNVLPGLAGLEQEEDTNLQLSRAVEANVRWTTHQMLQTPEGQARLAEGRCKLAGAVYDLESGRVRFIE